MTSMSHRDLNTSSHSIDPTAAPSSPSSTYSPELGDLFHNLPGELRERIFASLLVRPVKWDLKHAPGCPKLTVSPPDETIRWLVGAEYPARTNRTYTCATALKRWGAHLGQPTWSDPWRSRWAPPQTNPYVCSRCFDERLRPSPRTFSLPCLCPRRGDDLNVFLVCRAWYAEAGRVFYSGNVMAFAHTRECVAFFRALSPRWKPLVTKVSLLALPPKDVVPRNAREELEMVTVTVGGEDGLREALAALRSLPALAELELDAALFREQEAVNVIREVSFPRLRSLWFVKCTIVDWLRKPETFRPFVWPQQRHRHVLESEAWKSLADRVRGREERDRG
ncbi:hypothetical protein PG993_002257 [Apiospora rasikravindrae]|uniref:Uncharacterized protein n=1 Tax=Apiospora rasikravindrae TaxID=990691 RepID=A0ABR1TWI5_9PEZI